MACTTAIYSVENTRNKLHIQYPLHFFCQNNLYHDKQDIMDELCHQCHLPLLEYINHPALITEWKNIDSAAHENKYKQINKATIKEERN